MKSFKLLFKNGFKQLFQFKFSLMAILILAMVGTLVISTSVTTVKKLDSEFDKVVNSQEKFSNVYENTADKSLGNDFGYLPILDLVSKEESTSAFINFRGEVQSNFNLNLTDKKTFIGEYFTSEQFKKIFPFLLSIYSTESRGNHLTMTPHTTLNSYFPGDLSGIDNETFKSEYGNYIKTWVPESIDDISISKDAFKLSPVNSKEATWYSYATDVFFYYFANKMSSYTDEELNNSLVGEYTKNSKSNSGLTWFDAFKWKTWNENLKDNKDNEHIEMYKYVHFALSTLISQIMYMSDEFFNEFKAVHNNFNNYTKLPVYAYAFVFGGEERYKDKDDVYNDTKKVYAETVEGTEFDWSKYLDPKYEEFNISKPLIDFSKTIPPVEEGVTAFNDTKSNINIIPDQDINPAVEFKENDFKNIVLKVGYRGTLNPLVTIKGNPDIEGDLPKVVAKNNFKSLMGITDGPYKNTIQPSVTQPQLLSAFYQSDESSVRAAQMYGVDFETLFSQISVNESGDAQFQPINHWSYFVNENVYKNPINYYYKMHLKMAKESAGMEMTIRDELVYSDILAGKKYRLITMDSLENTNFEMIAGEAPKNRGEVAVSSQYAKYNNVKVGDLLKIGKSNLAVSGIAVDAFSFYPVVDPVVPVPKPKTSGIMYIKKETLNEIFKNDTTQMDMSSYKQSVYLFAKNDKQKNDFMYKANLSLSNYYQNYDNYINNKDQVSPVELVSFDDSTEALNWTVYELFIKAFLIAIVGIMIVILAAISIMLFLVIKKSIQMNLEKIAILISIGYRPFEISVSYIWYSIAITSVALPLGWIFGTLLQLPIERLLQDFFTIDAKVIMFSWEALLISFALISVTIGFALTMMIAWRKMSKPYIELMNENNIPNTNRLFGFIKTKIIGRNGKGFKRRFAFDVASGSSKSLLLMSALLAVSALMISNLIFIPSVALTTKSKYNENVKYKNSFEFNDPVSNDPLAAKNINFWEGVQDNIDNMIKIDYEIGKTKDTKVINNYNGYKSISSNSSFMPELLYSADKDESGKPTNNIRSSYSDMVENPSEILSVLLGSFMYNLHNSNGKSLSIGMFDQFISEYLNEDNGLSMNAKVKAADRVAKVIGGALPTILKMVNFPNMEFDNGDDWKESLLRSFTTKAPSYIKEYIGVKERQSAINFGFNTVNVVPGKDSLGTALTLDSNNGDLNVVGVDSNQTAFEVPERSFDQLYGSDKEINEIYQYLNGSVDQVSSNNQYLKDDVLTIPVIINQAKKIVDKVNVGNIISDINTNSNKYVLNTDQIKDLVVPNAAWKYDDTDFVRSDYYKNNEFDKEKFFDYSTDTDDNESTRHYYKNAFTIDPNKVSYKNQYTHVVSGNKDRFYESLDQTAKDYSDVNNPLDYEVKTTNVKLKDNTYMFGDFAYEYNDAGKTVVKASYTRPYYNYRNFKLFIPTSLITKGDKNSDQYNKDLYKFIFNNGTLSNNANKLAVSGWTTDNKSLGANNAKTIDKKLVPEDTIKAYEANGVEKLDDWVAIKPYDIDPLTTERGTEQYLTGVSSDGTILYWLKNMLTRVDNDLTGMSIKTTSMNNIPDVKVQLKVVDIMDTYNGVGIITNSDLLNLLLSVENNKQTVFDGSRLDKYKENGKVSGIKQYGKKEFKAINTKDWWLDAYVKTHGSDQERINQVNSSLINKYSNSIYSNVDEPLQITTGVSMQTANSTSTFAIHDDLNTYGVAIEGTNLLEEQREVIDQLFKIAMFIALIFITIILIIVIIVILISSDIYLSRLRMFIVSLKAFGYKKREIWGLLFGISFVLVIFATMFGFLLSWGMVSGVIAIIINMGMAVPFVVSPWVPLITFSLIVPVWIIGSLIISNKILLLKPVDGFKQN